MKNYHKIILTFFKKGVDKSKPLWYNIVVPLMKAENERTKCWCGSMAEQLICNQQVVGSTPITSSKDRSIDRSNKGDFPSGQRGQTVNLLSLTSVVRIHHPPPKKALREQCFFAWNDVLRSLGPWYAFRAWVEYITLYKQKILCYNNLCNFDCLWLHRWKDVIMTQTEVPHDLKEKRIRENSIAFKYFIIL